MPRIISGTTYDDSKEVLAFNEFPVGKSDASSEVSIVRPKRIEVVENPGVHSILESMSRIGRRCGKSKPTYADCWVVGCSDDIEKLEEYETPFANIIVGNADDGEVEYNVTPGEYTYPAALNELIEKAIETVRKEYRKTGGKMDRNRVISSSKSFFLLHEDDIVATIPEGCRFVDAVAEFSEIVYRYTMGLGIFDILLNDTRLEDIYIDAPCDENRIHVTLNQLTGYNSHVRCRTNLMADRREVKNLINTLMRESGLPFCESNPVLETNMSNDLARATIVGYPMSPNGDSVAIRKHSVTPWTLTRLISNGTINAHTAGLISFLVDNRSTFLVCGARGSGKSSILSAMMFEFPIAQRILTIEDTLELPGEKMRSMGYKVQSMLIDDRMDGDANQRADEALRVSLRLGESAIILGEVRGEEAKTLYQSMRTGRAGSSIMGTIHGDSAKTVYERVVHDMQISPEAFMATDFLITMGTVRERGSSKQVRRMSEFVSTTDKAGKFIDITNEKGLSASPAVKRIIASTSMTIGDVCQEIETRSQLRQFLSDMSSTYGDGFNGPEWVALANDHLAKNISAGVTDTEAIVSSFKDRFRRFNGGA